MAFPVRLKAQHPAYIAFMALCERATELDIAIEFRGTRTILVHNGKYYDIEELEGDQEPVQEFPPTFEVKLVMSRV